MQIGRSKQFDKQFKKLSPKLQDQFFDRLYLFLASPDHHLLHVHNLAGKYHGQQSFNVNANVRAIFMLDADRLFFTAIGTHSQLYK